MQNITIQYRVKSGLNRWTQLRQTIDSLNGLADLRRATGLYIGKIIGSVLREKCAGWPDSQERHRRSLAASDQVGSLTP
jgi:hypothetical protein